METVKIRTLYLVLLLFIAESKNLYKNETSTNKTASSSAPKHLYDFYRSLNITIFEYRRVFGGQEVDIGNFPGICALVDRYKFVKCTGSIISPFWVLTAAHCISPKLAFVIFNAKTSDSPKANSSTITYLYKHPEFKTVQQWNRGMDVTLLHHDVGLVRTRDVMVLSYIQKRTLEPIRAMLRFNPIDLNREKVQIIGYGRTEKLDQRGGEQLMGVTLRLRPCDRASWQHCMCAFPINRVEGWGVCSGDSGGPVIYRGIQIGVTSMGPVKCASPANASMDGATTVFTTLYHYANLINDTITKTDTNLRASSPTTVKASSNATQEFIVDDDNTDILVQDNSCALITSKLFALTVIVRLGKIVLY